MSACSSGWSSAVSTALLALPPLALVVRSLRVGNGYGLDHFRSLAHETPALLVAPWHAIVNSLVFARGATAIALAVGVPAAVAVARGRGGLDTLVMLPLGASAVMLGFGFLLAFDEPPLDLRSSAAIVPIAQSLVAIPFVVRALAPALRAIDVRLREAAAVLGASPARVRREIELPLLARPLAVAAGLAFAIALGEFGATVFVARADWPTVPVAIFRFLGRPGAENVGTAMALCVVLMGLVAATRPRVGAGARPSRRGVSLALEDVDVVLDGAADRPRRRPRGRHRRAARRARAERVGQVDAPARRSPACSRPSRGRVLLDGRDVTGVPPHRRGIGLIFQDAALFPHRDVAGNVGFGLRVRGARRRRSGRGASGAARARRARGRGASRRRDALGRRGPARRARPGARPAPAASCSSTSRSARSTGRCATGCSPTCARSSRRSA